MVFNGFNSLETKSAPLAKGGKELGDGNMINDYFLCCQQYILPLLALRLHWVPFCVIAWHLPEEEEPPEFIYEDFQNSYLVPST